MELSLWAMLEGFVPIPDIIKEMDLVSVRKQRGTDAMYRSITPSLVLKNQVGALRRQYTIKLD